LVGKSHNEEMSMNFLPTVVHAEYRGDFRIHVGFNDGVEGRVDFSPWLAGPVFEPLKDPGYFARFFIEAGTVTWPNGADIAPETLHQQAKVSEAA
jgi:hypothetical protein